MKRILFLVLSLGCVVGRTRSLVEHTSRLHDGSERKVAHSTWGVGAFPPSPGASAGEIATADLETVQAGQIEAWGMYCRGQDGRADWRCLGNYGIYGYGGIYGGVPLSGAPLVGGYTIAGANRAAELRPLISPPPNYIVIQGQPVWDTPDAGAQAPEGVPPEPAAPQHRAEESQADAPPPDGATLACAPDNTHEYLDGRVKEMDKLLRKANPDRTLLNRLLHEVDDKLKEAEDACEGNSAALTELDKKREEVDELRKRINTLERKP